ncbi:MAG: hypothetical protein KDA41_16175, partial [Planctomycetales bacterium]|nr:hypothetical protein [Planctomycetales bacterium]
MHSDQRISVGQAARMIYRTSRPKVEQLQRVQELIVRRDLKGDSHGTTVAAVTDFLAARAVKPGLATSRPKIHEEAMRRVYQDSMRDFFLAVFARRKVHGAGKLFQRAVLATQIVVLVVALATTALSLRAVFPPLAPERAAVLDWLNEN